MLSNKDRIEILSKRVDTLHDWVASLQKEKQVEDEAEVIEQAMTNVARKAEIEDEWLNVLTTNDSMESYEMSISHEEAAKRLNNLSKN